MQTKQRAAPSPKNAASTTNAKHITTSAASGATIRRPLTPPLGPFWQSVGEAIEQAARAAGRAS